MFNVKFVWQGEIEWLTNISDMSSMSVNCFPFFSSTSVSCKFILASTKFLNRAAPLEPASPPVEAEALDEDIISIRWSLKESNEPLICRRATENTGMGIFSVTAYIHEGTITLSKSMSRQDVRATWKDEMCWSEERESGLWTGECEDLQDMRCPNPADDITCSVTFFKKKYVRIVSAVEKTTTRNKPLWGPWQVLPQIRVSHCLPHQCQQTIHRGYGWFPSRQMRCLPAREIVLE